MDIYDNVGEEKSREGGRKGVIQGSAQQGKPRMWLGIRMVVVVVVVV